MKTFLLISLNKVIGKSVLVDVDMACDCWMLHPRILWHSVDLIIYYFSGSTQCTSLRENNCVVLCVLSQGRRRLPLDTGELHA